jgi:DNA end-binding protein Ku
MALPSLWSGNLRLSLVLIPVRLVPAVSTEEAISFRQIHEPSGTPIRQVKGVRDGDTFTEVPDEEIVKGYEYAKGSHVLIDPKEIDDLKLEAKHTIDMVRFVDEDEIDTRYWEKPYYLVPDGDEADEGYAIMQRALAETGKVAIGQLILHGRQHLVGIKVLKGGLMLSILRYAAELRDPKPYFEGINFEPQSEAVGLAKELIEAETGRFEPEKIPDKYAETLRELLQAKVEERAPQIEVAPEGRHRKSSTSWRRLRRVCRQKDAPRCGTQCGGEWASPLRRTSQGRGRHDRDQASVERRIDVNRLKLNQPSSWLPQPSHYFDWVQREFIEASPPVRSVSFRLIEFHQNQAIIYCLFAATQRGDRRAVKR